MQAYLSRLKPTLENIVWPIGIFQKCGFVIRSDPMIEGVVGDRSTDLVRLREPQYRLKRGAEIPNAPAFPIMRRLHITAPLKNDTHPLRAVRRPGARPG